MVSGVQIPSDTGAKGKVQFKPADTGPQVWTKESYDQSPPEELGIIEGLKAGESGITQGVSLASTRPPEANVRSPTRKAREPEGVFTKSQFRSLKRPRREEAGESQDQSPNEGEKQSVSGQ